MKSFSNFNASVLFWASFSFILKLTTASVTGFKALKMLELGLILILDVKSKEVLIVLFLALD